eukprot:gene12224-13484_t
MKYWMFVTGVLLCLIVTGDLIRGESGEKSADNNIDDDDDDDGSAVFRSGKHKQSDSFKTAGIHWLDKNHKIFKDHQNDIVISLHARRGSKKDQRPLPLKTKNNKSKIRWVDKAHKIFYDGQNDIVTSLHNQRGIKKTQRPKPLNGPSGKIKWVDKAHKIFYDGQNDIVTSLHNQRGVKKTQRPKPLKSHSGKIRWADKAHKVFYDSQNDIVTSLHNQHGVRKSQRPADVKYRQDGPKEEAWTKKSLIPRHHVVVAGKRSNVVTIPAKEAHRFLGTPKTNEASEVELLNLAPKKQAFMSNNADVSEETVLSANALEEEAKVNGILESRLEAENSGKNSNNAADPQVKPLSITFRNPNPYKPLQSTESENGNAPVQSQQTDARPGSKAVMPNEHEAGDSRSDQSGKMGKMGGVDSSDGNKESDKVDKPARSDKQENILEQIKRIRDEENQRKEKEREKENSAAANLVSSEEKNQPSKNLI